MQEALVALAFFAFDRRLRGLLLFGERGLLFGVFQAQRGDGGVAFFVRGGGEAVAEGVRVFAGVAVAVQRFVVVQGEVLVLAQVGRECFFGGFPRGGVAGGGGRGVVLAGLVRSGLELVGGNGRGLALAPVDAVLVDGRL